MVISIQCTLQLPDDRKAKRRVQEVIKKRKASEETIEEAWERILQMKNSETDKRRLGEVKDAMGRGAIGRHPAAIGRRFSKAEALRLWRELQEQRREQKLVELVENTPNNYILVNNSQSLRWMIFDIKEADLIAVDCETFGDKPGDALDPWNGYMAGFSVSTESYHYYVPLNHIEPTNLTEQEIIKTVKKPLEQVKTVMHNASFDCKWFWLKYGINLIDNLYADTRIMAMAFDENRSHRLKDLVTDWLREPSDNFDELFGKTQFNEVPLNVALVYAAGDMEKTLKLYHWIKQWYDKRDDLKRIKRLVFDIEMPVCREFIKADLRGIKFDTERAHGLDAELAKEESQLQQDIYKLLGDKINLNSPAQLKEKLFRELRLPDYDKGSTGVKTLKKLKSIHPVIPKILEYREVGKLRQAFTSKLPGEVRQDNKIHPWFNTWGAATGRFTCNSPNLQQIPAKRSEVRKLFCANGKDRILVSADYSQIEIRCLAHLANEQVLIKAIEAGRDVHSTTAAMISGGKASYDDVERDREKEGTLGWRLRNQAKVVNFGLIYGMSAKGLAATLEITQAEAELLMKNYFEGYPGIKGYMDIQKKMARNKGYVLDIFGRKRRLRNAFRTQDYWRKLAAERQAGNFPIQSSAGSILKKAVVDLIKILPQMDVKILLQVHDELIFDCPKDITVEELTLIKTTMENAVKLKVPVKADIDIYPERWAEKVSWEEWFGK